jgi:hypothetical protein
MKPLQGVSFDIGTKRAVSYFLIDGNSCKLTLMLAEVVHGDEVNGLTATRVTVAIEAGKAAQLDTVEGKTLEFKCQGGAHVMSVEASDQARQHHAAGDFLRFAEAARGNERQDRFFQDLDITRSVLTQS